MVGIGFGETCFIGYELKVYLLNIDRTLVTTTDRWYWMEGFGSGNAAWGWVGVRDEPRTKGTVTGTGPTVVDFRLHPRGAFHCETFTGGLRCPAFLFRSPTQFGEGLKDPVRLR